MQMVSWTRGVRCGGVRRTTALSFFTIQLFSSLSRRSAAALSRVAFCAATVRAASTYGQLEFEFKGKFTFNIFN